MMLINLLIAYHVQCASITHAVVCDFLIASDVQNFIPLYSYLLLNISIKSRKCNDL